MPPAPGPSLLSGRPHDLLAPRGLDGELDTDVPREEAVETATDDVADVAEEVFVTAVPLVVDTAVAAVGLHVAQINTLKPRPSQRGQTESLAGE